MFKEIKSIEFIFENCESLSIPKNCIGLLDIEGIHDVIRRMAMNSIAKYTRADEFAIEIYKEADEEYHPFGNIEDASSKLKRLTEFNDIASIEVAYEDGSTDTLFLPYSDDDSLGACNAYQKTYVSKLGNVYIVVSKEKDIDFYFNSKDINDKEVVDSTKDLYDIGIEEEPKYDYGFNSIPEMYRYVYLYIDDEKEGVHKSALAVRVYDKDSGWKFITEDGIPFNVPQTWQYPASNIDKFINSDSGQSHINFGMAKIIESYPVPEKTEGENEFAEEARAAIKKAKDRYLNKEG